MKKRRESQTAAPTWAFPYRTEGVEVNLVLALGTVESRAPALDDAPDRSAACAGLAFAVVDRKTLREIAELAVRAGEVAQGRAAGGDGLGEHVVDRQDETLQALEGDRAARPLRMESGAVQRLADVDIAEAGDDSPVEQQQLDRRAPAGEPFPELARIEVERFGSQRLEGRPLVEGVGADEVERPEAPGVVESEAPPLLRLDQEMVVLSDLGPVDAPVSGHAEMENQGVAAVGGD